MNELKHYCPKCGAELTSCIKGYMKLYKCTNPECTYLGKTSKNEIDISFKSKGLAKALSNLCPYPFEFDGITCSSMEAFIQSLKVSDIEVQKDICSKTGPFCYSIREMHDDWRKTGTVHWKGKEICRHSSEYIDLITKAYEALLKQSPIYHYALKKVKENGYHLKHSIGCADSSETLLTPNEFIAILDYLIKECL